MLTLRQKLHRKLQSHRRMALSPRDDQGPFPKNSGFNPIIGVLQHVRDHLICLLQRGGGIWLWGSMFIKRLTQRDTFQNETKYSL